MAPGSGAGAAAGIGGCGAAADTVPAAAAGMGEAASAAALDAGISLSVSRRISFTFCTTDSHKLFCAATSIIEVAPVALGPPACGLPNCVEAIDCIFTLRVALR